MSSYQDTMLILGVVVLLAFVAVIATLVVTNIGSALNDAFTGEPRVQDIVDDYSTGLPKIIDWLFTIVFVSLPLIGFGLGVLVRVSPVWFWVYVALSLPIMLVGIFIRDLWDVFTDPTVISDAASVLQVLNFIMQHYVEYCVFVFLIIGLGTYAKIRGLEVFGGGYV